MEFGREPYEILLSEKKGLFIVFEGLDTSGKSSILEQLKKDLNSNLVVFTSEPTGVTESAEAIKRMLLEPKTTLSKEMEALLFLVNRRLHLEEVIKPALEDYKVVISDRYFFSSWAYQAAETNKGKGFNFSDIRRMNNIVSEFIYPDLVIYFDISLKQFKERAGTKLDCFEARGDSYISSVLARYQKIFKSKHKLLPFWRSQVFVVDATQTPERVYQTVKEVIDEWIATRRVKDSKKQPNNTITSTGN